MNNLQRRYTETSSEYVKEEIDKFMSATTCKTCKGARLKPEALAVTVNGENIATVTTMSVEKAEEFFKHFTTTQREEIIANQILKEVRARLGFLTNVGLGYLNLSRSATTLSGGESQRIRLATRSVRRSSACCTFSTSRQSGCINATTIVCSRPSRPLRDLGNTLIVIEHDEDTMREADVIVDIGPGAGAEGGRILTVGTLEEIVKNDESLTGAYLSGRQFIAIPEKRREPRGWLNVRNAKANNLTGLDVDFPIGVFAAVTGVSGSGKSTLVNEVLVKALNQHLHGAPAGGTYGTVKGAAQLDKMVVIDQSPIGRTPRSNPATYTGFVRFDPRAFLARARIEVARLRARALLVQRKGRPLRGVPRRRASSRSRCTFLPDVYVPCEVCKGKALQRADARDQIQGQVRLRHPRDARRRCGGVLQRAPPHPHAPQTITDVGLGYIKMGQPATTTSRAAKRSA